MTVTNNNWSAKRPLVLGFLALALLVLGIGAWSVTTNIAGAVVATGLIEVEANRQVVQHPDGGVIKEILVDDGDMVEAGEILLRFDNKYLQSDLTVTTEQLLEITARKARLKAERDGSDKLDFSEVVLDAGDSLVVAELMSGQNNLFLARRDSLDREAALLTERKAQIEEQITGAQAQKKALKLQQSLIAEELVDETLLLEKGLSQATTVRSLKREAARLEGLIAELVATVAERRGKIAEIEIEVLRLKSRLREGAITKLRDLQYLEIELREAQTSLLETLQRMDIRAPSSGIIYGKQFHSLRSVVQPAETIMHIVPQDAPLVVAAHISAIHVDQVLIGQVASLRFSAFDMRTTPIILGRVTKISPDVFVDEMTGASYYLAEIVPETEELIKLDGLEILPGMPVDAFLKTGERTPLEYLVKPLADYFRKAFRES